MLENSYRDNITNIRVICVRAFTHKVYIMCINLVAENWTDLWIW